MRLKQQNQSLTERLDSAIELANVEAAIGELRRSVRPCYQVLRRREELRQLLAVDAPQITATNGWTIGEKKRGGKRT